MSEKKIDWTNQEYDRAIQNYKLIDDLCDSQNLQDYIVKLNPSDTSAEMELRREQYFETAVYYPIAGYTARGLVGVAFTKQPAIKIPAGLEYVEDNVDGSGESIYQQSQAVVRSLVRKGRAGLLVDFPATDGSQASKLDIQNGSRFASIQRFEPAQILPVEMVAIGSKVKISRVRLKDTVEENGESEDIIRELYLDESGIYTSQEWRKDPQGQWYRYKEASVPLDGEGKPWDEIPFIICGSETNTRSYDKEPMYDLCQINKGHFNNSAAYEDMLHFAGQAQPWSTGMTQGDLDILKSEKIQIGSGQLINIADPSGKFGYAQVQTNAIAKEGMDFKLKLMIGQGAFFIEPGSAPKTATESRNDQKVQHSILSLITSNVSEAYTKCLYWMAKFMRINETAEMEYSISQDFTTYQADAQMILAMMQAAAQGKLRTRAFVAWQQKNGLEDPEKDIDEILEELEAENPAVSMPNLGGEF